MDTVVVNISTLREIATVLVTIAFFGVCLWVFSPKLKKRFEEDARLPFAEDDAVTKKSDPKADKPKD
ncbi:MAG: cytochrome-c oxidase [Cellvibrio sp.]|jgi:cytochrome c oxidase cbb3-type subunit 4|nr:cytochrome-c oxidase [Cellvibrio sp.]